MIVARGLESHRVAFFYSFLKSYASTLVTAWLKIHSDVGQICVNDHVPERQLSEIRRNGKGAVTSLWRVFFKPGQ